MKRNSISVAVAALASAMAVAFGVLSSLGAAQADDKLAGSWKLVAFYVQASDTQERKDALGPKPQGRLILTSTGFISNFRVADGRLPAQTDAEQAALVRTMAAWTGRYRVDGDKLLIRIESSWNERVNGETARTYTIEGKRLTLTNVTSSSNFFPGRPAVGNEVFERED